MMAKIRIKKEFENNTYSGIDFTGGKPLYKVKYKDLSEKFVSLWYELITINKGNLKYFEVYEPTNREGRKSAKELYTNEQGVYTEEGRDNSTEAKTEVSTDTE